MKVLAAGGHALDAVEIACRVVEDDPEDHSVGYSGLPNVLGEVELDASIMDGRTRAAGAVAALHGYGRAISLARRVLEETPHVLICARGAERLAADLGEPPQDQRTDEALRRWSERFAERGLDPHAESKLHELAGLLTRPINLQDKVYKAGRVDTLGTVNFLALDQYGDLASAVSTSGLGWKYPGRIGDSPLIGPGNYCDNRYGAAACTGMGELAIRAGTAHSVVLYMKMGLSLRQAGLEALADLQGLASSQEQYMNIVALTPAGEHAGFTTVPGKKYLYFRSGMDEPALAERLCLPA
jgi:beta-aspartyl-peptidase (threonine type)